MHWGLKRVESSREIVVQFLEREQMGAGEGNGEERSGKRRRGQESPAKVPDGWSSLGIIYIPVFKQIWLGRKKRSAICLEQKKF